MDNPCCKVIGLGHAKWNCISAVHNRLSDVIETLPVTVIALVIS
jgi:hypothetical protein